MPVLNIRVSPKLYEFLTTSPNSFEMSVSDIAREALEKFFEVDRKAELEKLSNKVKIERLTKELNSQ